MKLRALVPYLVGFLAVWLPTDVFLRYYTNDIDLPFALLSSFRKPTIRSKVNHYRENAPRYDLIFIGDSKTYCAMAPRLLDPILGTHSYNLAAWANWFPTQYPSFQDIAPLIPEGTMVVWSIGHQNFRPVRPRISSLYPIGWRNVPDYLRWGFAWGSISGNLLDNAPALKLYALRGSVHRRWDEVMARPLGGIPRRPHPPPANPVAARPAASPRMSLGDLDRLIDLEHASDVLHSETILGDGEVTSVALYKDGGNYVRIELQPAFFRAKQREMAARIRPRREERYAPDPAYWNLFVATLDLLQRRHVRLIVNELEEAPYNYAIPENRALYRGFMRDVRRYVQGRGIPYLRVDFDQLGDDEYFDYNHLNSRGVEHYTKLFAPELRRYLRRP